MKNTVKKPYVDLEVAGSRVDASRGRAVAGQVVQGDVGDGDGVGESQDQGALHATEGPAPPGEQHGVALQGAGGGV